MTPGPPAFHGPPAGAHRAGAIARERTQVAREHKPVRLAVQDDAGDEARDVEAGQAAGGPRMVTLQAYSLESGASAGVLAAGLPAVAVAVHTPGTRMAACGREGVRQNGHVEWPWPSWPW
jgi:hypothetical protein